MGQLDTTCLTGPVDSLPMLILCIYAIVSTSQMTWNLCLLPLNPPIKIPLMRPVWIILWTPIEVLTNKSSHSLSWCQENSMWPPSSMPCTHRVYKEYLLLLCSLLVIRGMLSILKTLIIVAGYRSGSSWVERHFRIINRKNKMCKGIDIEKSVLSSRNSEFFNDTEIYSTWGKVLCN